MQYIVVTPEVSQSPMSSLKDALAVLQEPHPERAQNKYDMDVTPDVSHVEMWPYAASAAALSESQRATAVLMLSLSSALPATAGTKLATHRSAASPIVVAQGQPYHAAAAAQSPEGSSKYGLELAGPVVRNILREEEDSEGARTPPAGTTY